MAAKVEHFSAVIDRAAERKGGEEALAGLVMQPRSDDELSLLTSDRVLAQMTKSVFQSGFVWRVVEKKWPDFEEHFFGFELDKILMMPDDMLERKATDPKIIRNLKKVMTIRDNAQMIKDIEYANGPVGQFIADWPADNIIGLCELFKRQGSRLGGFTGYNVLRALGKDTFRLSSDVEGYMRSREVITGGLQTKGSLKAIQQQFNQWQQQTGLSLTELSMILAYSCGDNRVGFASD
ncbi:DNA-3-methyladenine glycosylase I [Psychrobium sp. 1_MG-2023]|uniref:DNA-3-methyladenine glycosylase I n=1 Tax=Psychrobium sp. 1_MG-2023 TaxID=3062624 RepID=UPI000C320877|nr:DNA-3-methyladenine glycosylase I [Psychrobium sp. 1_MG-2023]MDP2560476.1 DNA-3-methyladenine glycosylase I [Psychrobium sp. 1_MG-2023]PKF57864.1 3-methyladenine DNA glycosylase [Alteromonadales bacterium alter-6D02]